MLDDLLKIDNFKKTFWKAIYNTSEVRVRLADPNDELVPLLEVEIADKKSGEAMFRGAFKAPIGEWMAMTVLADRPHGGKIYGVPFSGTTGIPEHRKPPFVLLLKVSSQVIRQGEFKSLTRLVTLHARYVNLQNDELSIMSARETDLTSWNREWATTSITVD